MTSVDGRTQAEPAPLSFADDCKRVLQGMRGALTEALGELGVDPARPQEVSRQLGLHRNLTWKLSKIVTGTNVFAAVPHVPGRSGVEIVLKALRKAGLSAVSLGRLETAMAEFERLVQVHAGDRATLELVAGGFVPGASQREAMLQARRSSFRGNSAIWGVQARVLMAVHILAPNKEDPTKVDVTMVNGLVDFRRLGPDVAWPLFRRAVWDDSGAFRALAGRPISASCDGTDVGEGATGVPLLREFCSPGLDQLNVYETEKEIVYELPSGPVGRSGELTCLYGSVIPALGSQYAEREPGPDGERETCEMAHNLMTPVEMLHTDLLVHESLTWAMNPSVEVFSQLEGRSTHHGERRANSRLSVDSEVHEMGQGLTSMSTPHVPRHRELLSHVFEQVGLDSEEFRGFRFVMNYPPIPALAVLSMDLLPKPAG